MLYDFEMDADAMNADGWDCVGSKKGNNIFSMLPLYHIKCEFQPVILLVI